MGKRFKSAGSIEVCRAKVRRATKAEALSAAARLLRSGKRNTRYLRPYRCPHCGGWHLTHTRKR